jgi:hypothetical protein
MKKQISILELRPTQFVLGIKEITSKVEKMSKASPSDLKKYCQEHVIPVVMGPKNQYFMIDHHHFARACWETKTEGFQIQILKDLSHLPEKDFWNYMIKNDWTYLHDQFGLGPHSPSALPTDIRCLADDPYRSLAWAVRENGAFKKVDVPFFEFKWAAFFRQNLTVPLHSKSDFKNAIKEATLFARSAEASHLPGYSGKKKSSIKK